MSAKEATMTHPDNEEISREKMLGSLLTDEPFKDVSLKGTDGESVRARRFALAARSLVFRRSWQTKLLWVSSVTVAALLFLGVQVKDGSVRRADAFLCQVAVARQERQEVTARNLNCTAELLSSSAEHGSGWIRSGNDSDKDSGWHWRVSSLVQEACQISSPQIHPLQSTRADMQQTLQNRWILMVGDSSVRMLHDYLVGRWLGNYHEAGGWPSHKWDNHGPKSHSRLCYGLAPDCYYDVYKGGARVTFVWQSLNVSPQLNRIFQQTVGLPDLIVGQHGYWELHRYGNSSWLPKEAQINKTMTPQETAASAQENAETIVQTITDWTSQREMQSEYANAYLQQHPHKIWLSSFAGDCFKLMDPNYSKNYDQYDASRKARDLGWDIFDRTALGNIDPRTDKPSGPHPMEEVLDIELEMLLLLIKNLPRTLA